MSDCAVMLSSPRKGIVPGSAAASPAAATEAREGRGCPRSIHAKSAISRSEAPEEVAATLRAAMKYVAADHLFPCTNCGMAPMARDVAEAKLRALAAGAALVRRELGRS